MTTEWYRNTTWNEAVKRTFEEKLRRARMKGQYLRIQAWTLARSHPEVALELLDRYFLLPNDIDHAQGHVDRATALLALGRVAEAIASYEAALASEANFPNIQTQAYLELPYLVATRGIREDYDRALQLLEVHHGRLTFPVERFRWHAARALIASDSQQMEIAKAHAERALENAACRHSGFQHHPTVGLVNDEHRAVMSKLETFRAS